MRRERLTPGEIEATPKTEDEDEFEYEDD